MHASFHEIDYCHKSWRANAKFADFLPVAALAHSSAATPMFSITLSMRWQSEEKMTNYRADYLTAAALSNMPFKSLGDDVMIHERVTLVGIENISIGSHVRIDPDVILLATGPLTIGCYTHIATGVFIAAKAGFEMRNFANIAHGTRIYTINDDYSGEHLMGPTIPPDLLKVNHAPVLMEEHTIIGAGAVVLPGVTLAEGSLLGALSLLDKPTDPWTMYGGVPAKSIKKRRRDSIEKGKELLASNRFMQKSTR